ncbi:hypothetical protein BJ166DRAFT_317920 [Pestalotiopsis sp. NC0098]|nr:hypothetical protein BJ166DRAFT_317920 [Pestalotiopsis sp. NC0098]
MVKFLLLFLDGSCFFVPAERSTRPLFIDAQEARLRQERKITVRRLRRASSYPFRLASNGRFSLHAPPPFLLGNSNNSSSPNAPGSIPNLNALCRPVYLRFCSPCMKAWHVLFGACSR